MKPEAILFDLDDTIISFDLASDYAWKEMCNVFVNTEKPNFSSDLLLETINKTRKWYWDDPERHKEGRMNMTKARRDIVKKALNELNYYEEKISNDMADNYSNLQEDSISLFPDTIESLEKFLEKGIRMALITNGSSIKQRAKIDRFKLSKYFEFCLIEEEIGIGKPDTKIFFIALNKLKLNASEVWMIGDNLKWDVEAPQKVGIFSIWNDFRRSGLPKGSKIVPDKIINSIVEVARELENSK